MAVDTQAKRSSVLILDGSGSIPFPTATIDSASRAALTQSYGGIAAAVAVTPPGLTFGVYDASTGLTLLRTLAEDFARSIQDAANDVGSIVVTVPRGGVDAPYLLTDRILRVAVDGIVRFSGRIGPWDQHTISSGEEVDENLTLTLPGVLGTLKDGIVEPHADAALLLSDTRFFNFASPEFNATSWLPAVQQFRQDDTVNNIKGTDAPLNWPDPTAYWIWSQLYNLGDSPPTPVGDAYFRATVTVTEGDHSLFIAGDDGYELWVDGVLQAAQTKAFEWRNTATVNVFLHAGSHTIAVKGTNITRTSVATNVGMFLFAMYSTSNGGELDTLVLHSDSTWTCVGYPATPPGFTPGMILRLLAAEVQARGGLALWTWDFTDTRDSAGVLWANTVEISFRVGETILDVLRKLAETWVDFTADYDHLILRAVNKGGFDTGAAVALTVGSTITDLHHSGDPAYTTDLLVHGGDGTYTAVASGAGGPRVEALLEAGSAPSPGAATALVTGIFNRYSAEKVLTTIGVLPAAGSAPYVDFWNGKNITVPDRFLAGKATRVQSITITDTGDQDGFLEGSYAVTVQGVQ